MAAVERDDDRWQLALTNISELSQSNIDLRKMVQNGFGSLGTELDALRQQLSTARTLLIWLLVINAFNLLGWLSVVALLVYVAMRLFSVT